MLSQVQLLDEMDETTWKLLWKNLTGITESELDWRPHPEANNIRWQLGHLTWFEEWVTDAIDGAGRYLQDERPQAYVDQSFAVIRQRFESARQQYLERIATLSESDLSETRSFFGTAEVTIMQLLRTHTLHLAGHRAQVRYIRGTYSRAHGTSKAAFDPW